MQVLRLVRADPHPVALFGAWAGGCDIVGSRPRLVRSSASGPLDDVLDDALPATAVPDRVPARTRRSAAGGSATWGTAPRARRCRRPARGGCPRGGSAGTTTCCAGTGRRGSGSSRRCALMARPWSSGSRICRGGPRNRPPAPATSSAATSGWSRPRAQHRAAVRAAVEYIGQGDIFQANICLRAEAELPRRPARRVLPGGGRPGAPVRRVPRRTGRRGGEPFSRAVPAPRRRAASSPSPSRARRPATRPTATRPKRSGPPWSARRRTARRT